MLNLCTSHMCMATRSVWGAQKFQKMLCSWHEASSTWITRHVVCFDVWILPLVSSVLRLLEMKHWIIFSAEAHFYGDWVDQFMRGSGWTWNSEAPVSGVCAEGLTATRFCMALISKCKVPQLPDHWSRKLNWAQRANDKWPNGVYASEGPVRKRPDVFAILNLTLVVLVLHAHGVNVADPRGLRVWWECWQDKQRGNYTSWLHFCQSVWSMHKYVMTYYLTLTVTNFHTVSFRVSHNSFLQGNARETQL